MWTAREIKNHELAAKRLLIIKDLVFAWLAKHPGASEFQAHQFILRQYRKFNLVTDTDQTIVSFGKNTASVHYYPKKKIALRLKPNTLVMIDIWARLNKPKSPFADITWMGYYGNSVPVKMKRVFDLVIEARDKSLKYIMLQLKNKRLPLGSKIDEAARSYISHAGFGPNFLHTTGHCLGFNAPHGDGVSLYKDNRRPVLKNMGYTIEPGVYLKNEFGVRSETDFYINNRGQMVIIAGLQQELVKMN